MNFWMFLLRMVRAGSASVARVSLRLVVLAGLVLLVRWGAMPPVPGKRHRIARQSAHTRSGAFRTPREDQLQPCQPAEEDELGPVWHQGGRRRWLWLHDGQKQNGWIELGHGGVLRSSFGSGSWKLDPKIKTRLIVTFGRCHHVVELLPNVEVPTFKVIERQMKDQSKTRERVPKTRGRLDMDGAQT